MADINQELLIAALTLLTSAVPRDAVHTALLKWTENPEHDLAQLLKEGGWLDKGQVEALRCLVAAHLRNHNGDLRASIDAWNAHALTQDLLTEIERTSPGSTLGEALSQSLGSTVGVEHGVGGSVGAPREPPNFTQDQRFVRIKLHAQGGIGDVYLARDRELQRDVALKEIQQRHVNRRDQQDRFLLEAEITGNLEHPGIVPVYSLGRNAAGKPFYAMRFIEGESLGAAIKRFHQERKQAAAIKQGRAGSPWGVEFQQLLRRFLDVCDAIEYAHSRNVIHRDLKPGNIMLGKYGETLVVDWGLAKIVGRSDIVAEQVESGKGEDFDLTQAAGGMTATAGGETQPGTTIGTPSYMSPEQAKGAIGELGPASDVYSLGATLYELLTGVAPYLAKTPPEVIRLVKEGKLTSPRTLQPSLPAPLEAICLKAMAYQHQDRYPSARELAHDLEHWMADEPVAAYPERAPEKLARWLRQHRTLTYGVGTTLAGITLVATIALFVLNDARRREADARGEAEGNFNMALQAVDNYLTNVSENRLLKEQDTIDIRTLRQELLESALPFYKEFVAKRGQDPKLRVQLANAYFRLGDITRVIGTIQDALEHYRSSYGIWEQLVSADPDNLEFQSRLADCDTEIGRLVESENLPESLSLHNRALRIYQQLVAQRQTDLHFQAKLGTCCSDVALCLSKLKEFDQSLVYFNQARANFEKLMRSHPDQTDYKRQLAETVNRIGYLEYTRFDYSAALEHYKEFQKMGKEILDAVTTGPKPLKIQDMLALSYFNIAVMYRDRAEAEASLEALGKAIEYWTRLAELAPSVTNYRKHLEWAYYQRGWTLHQVGRDSDALVSAKQSLDLCESLIHDEPENLDYQVDRADTLNLQGSVYYDSRQNEKAVPLFETVLDLRRSIVGRSSGIEPRKVDLCIALQNLGEAYLYRGEISRGMALRREEIGLRQELADSHREDRGPVMTGYVMDLVDALVGIGDAYRLSGEPLAARDTYDHAKAVLDSFLATHPDDFDLKGKLARVLERRASILDDSAQPQAAIDLLQKAVVLARESLNAKAKLAKPADALSESLWNLARLLRGRGDEKEAGRRDEERKLLWKGRPLTELLDLAKYQAARAEEIGQGKTQPATLGLKVREQDQAQAAESIKTALELGYKDIAHLRANPDFSPLLKRKELQSLLPSASR